MTELNIGDPAYASFGKYGRIDVKRGTVVKITPTGQIVVDFGEKNAITDKPQPRRFKGKRELGALWDSSGHLISREDYDRLSAEQKTWDTLSKAVELCRTCRFRQPSDLAVLIAKLNKLLSEMNGGGA